MEKRKTAIQKRLRDEVGLVVDAPRASGAGTSNDGNTDRRFFSDPQRMGEILGLDPRLLEQIHVLLSVLSSGLPIDPDAFKTYALETAQRYVSLYHWYHMPQSAHRMLIHGHAVIRRMSLPVGMMSEEAQEASNKVVKKFRERFTRKCSREKTNLDLMTRLLCHSDPLVSDKRESKLKKDHKRSLPAEAHSLLKAADPSELVF